MQNPEPLALIAEDEPLLAAALQAELARAWPQLRVHCVGDGQAAVRQALQLRPDVLFFDIRMPGLSGLQAAAELADAWDMRQQPFPALVFVTAHDEYAVQAFEAQAMDYLLKPVQPDRLHKTVGKLQQVLGARAPAAIDALASSQQMAEQTLQQLRHLLAANLQEDAPPAAPLTLIQASVGQAIHLLAIEQVLYFEAADKYVRVLTREREYLIRTPLKDLLPRLDAQVFWQIHRGTVVNSRAIAQVSRDEAGKTWLHLHGRPERLVVSRLYAGMFRAM